jgi:superfamily II DNA/RNA helicase
VLSAEEASLYRDATRFLRDLYKDGFYEPDKAEEEEDRARKKRYTGRGNLSRMIVMLCQRLCSSSAALAESLENLARGELITPQYRTRALDLASRARQVQAHAKLEALTKILSATSERFIVFSEHLATLRLIEERVHALSRKAVVFAGMVPRKERNERIVRFRDTEGAVFIATRAGAEGLNLQDRCSRLVNYELPWNPMVVEQRIGRVHRIGQQDEVHIFNFAAAATIETHVLRLLDQKIRLFELVVGELDVILGKFGEPEDLEKQLREAWLSSDSDEHFEKAVTSIGDRIVASREDGREQERIASEVAAEDPGTRLVREFRQLTIAARVRLGYGTNHLQVARGVDAKRRQLGLPIPEIMDALDGSVAEPAGTHDDFGPVFRVTGATARARAVYLVVAADRLPMVLVDLDTDPEAPLVADA